MNWQNTQFFFLLALLPALVWVVFLWSWRRQNRFLQKFASSTVFDRLFPERSFAKRLFRSSLLAIAVFFLVLALCRPQWGFQWEEVKREGVDIIVALDVSASMLAADVSPNRMTRAKREVVDLLRLLEGDRIGVIAFAGIPYLQCPLTLDYDAVQLFLNEVDTQLIPVPGTAIADAIELAQSRFQKQGSRSKALILITDGEDHGGDPIQAAQKAKKDGIRIFTIGIGDDNGAPIPMEKGGGFQKDAKGEVILTQLDESTLKQVALETGGAYVRSVTGDLDLERIYLKEIREGMEKVEFSSSRQKIWEDRFQWPLFLGFILLLLEPLVSDRKKSQKLNVWILCLLGTLFTATPSHAGLLGFGDGAESKYKNGKYQEALDAFLQEQVQHPDDDQLSYNIASTQYRLEKYEEARKGFLQSAQSTNKDLAFPSLYNLGNVSYYQGKLEEAISFYQQALKLKPDDEDAKHNLEFVQKELQRRMNEQNKPQDDSSNKDPDQAEEKNQQGNENQDQKEKDPSESQQASNDQQDQKSSQDESKQEQKQPTGQPTPASNMTEQQAEALFQNIEEGKRDPNARKIPLRGRVAPGGKNW